MLFDVVCQYKFWPQLQDLPFHRQLPHKNQFFFWINDNRTEENAAIFFHYFKFVLPSEIPRCLIISAGHEKTGLKPVFDNSAVCYDVVRHKGPDRLLRFACRLPPRLPSRSPSDHSLFECSQDIRITLMPSRVRVPSIFV